MTQGSEVWTWGLHLFAINNTDNIGCDNWVCHCLCGEGFTFWHFVVKRLGWSNMERPQVELCTMSLSTCGWPSGSIIGHMFNRFVMYVVWRIMRCSNHVVCDRCSIGWHVGCLTPPLMQVTIGDWVCPWYTKYTCFVVSCHAFILGHNMFFIGTMGDSKKVGIWLNRKDCS